MNTRQESNSNPIQRLLLALLPGGMNWRGCRLFASPRPAELVALRAMKCPAKHDRFNSRGYRNA